MIIKMETKVKTIDINAKQWFDKINGNSYFSAIVTINYGMKKEKRINIPFQYGYGDFYRFEAMKAVKKEYPELAGINDYGMHLVGIIVRSHIDRRCLKRDVLNLVKY